MIVHRWIEHGGACRARGRMIRVGVDVLEACRGGDGDVDEGDSSGRVEVR